MSKHITITGELGSGKSTVAKLVAQHFGFATFSTGDAQRLLAEQRHMTTLQLNQLSMTDKSIDYQIDSQFEKLAKEKTPYVVDSRLAFHFLPTSFKVMLTVDPQVGAERIMQANRSSEKAYTTVQDCLESNTKRRQMEQKRFMELYQVDISDKNNFDLVIDTTDKTPEDIAKSIISQYTQHCMNTDETFCNNP
ncbi:MAG: cytidylate kinase family protein [Alphaproteobacteria bacterium]|nr:cytidylate kinase family protein [Alphaproteobacteria bacterium]